MGQWCAGARDNARRCTRDQPRTTPAVGWTDRSSLPVDTGTNSVARTASAVCSMRLFSRDCLLRCRFVLSFDRGRGTFRKDHSHPFSHENDRALRIRLLAGLVFKNLKKRPIREPFFFFFFFKVTPIRTLPSATCSPFETLPSRSLKTNRGPSLLPRYINNVRPFRISRQRSLSGIRQ